MSRFFISFSILLPWPLTFMPCLITHAYALSHHPLFCPVSSPTLLPWSEHLCPVSWTTSPCGQEIILPRLVFYVYLLFRDVRTLSHRLFLSPASRRKVALWERWKALLWKCIPESVFLSFFYQLWTWEVVSTESLFITFACSVQSPFLFLLIVMNWVVTLSVLVRVHIASDWIAFSSVLVGTDVSNATSNIVLLHGKHSFTWSSAVGVHSWGSAIVFLPCSIAASISFRGSLASSISAEISFSQE